MAQSKQGSKVGLGIGLAALAAAAAGAYYFYGKDGAKHRKSLKGWAVKAQGEVMEKIEQLKDVTEPAYKKAVAEVMDQYRKVKSIDPGELKGLARELSGHWKNIAKHLKKPAPKKKVRR